MVGENESQAFLEGRPLAWARTAWLALALVLFGVVLASWPPYIRLLLTICESCQVTPAYEKTLQAMGVSLGWYAAFLIIPAALVTLGWMGIGALIFLVKSNDRRALLLSALLVLIGASFGGTIGFVGQYLPGWFWPGKIIITLSFPAMVALIYLFPNSTFKPRWLAWLLAVQTVLFLPVVFESLNVPIAYNFIIILSFVVSCIGVPLYRYRRVMTYAERQQTKWVMYGIVLAMAGIAMTIGMTVVLTATGLAAATGADSCATSNLYCDVVQNVGYNLSPLMIPIFIAIAILRSRLWDIDIIIRRTLQYSLVTGLLALTYFGLVILLQSVSFGRQQSQLIIVLSTLTIAALFNPLRRRVQDVIDRRFYRRKYNAQQLLSEFAQVARDEVDMDKLTATLIAIVTETMQPEKLSLWLKQPGEVSAADLDGP